MVKSAQRLSTDIACGADRKAECREALLVGGFDDLDNVVLAHCPIDLLHLAAETLRQFRCLTGPLRAVLDGADALIREL
jgi:hypothetical protein